MKWASLVNRADFCTKILSLTGEVLNYAKKSLQLI